MPLDTLLGLPMEWDSSSVAAFASSLLLAVFAVSIGALGKFKGALRWYALFGAMFGLASGLSNVLTSVYTAAGMGGTTQDFSFISMEVWYFAATANFLIAIALCFEVWATIRLLGWYGVSQPGRQKLGWAFVLGSVVLVSFTYLWEGVPMIVRVAEALSWTSTGVSYGWMAAAPVLLAQAFVRRRIPGQPILAAALCAYPIAYLTWGGLVGIRLGQPTAANGIIGLAAFLGTCSAWWWARERSGDRAAGRVAWVGVAMLGIGVGLATWKPEFSPAVIARTFDVVLVAYAILRYQYLGLDVKLRFGLSKSTVAAVFVAAFFMASEGAQVFFGDKFQSEYLGIAAAGVLVLAIAPLQRVADKFAAAAIPAAATPAPPAIGESGITALRQLAQKLGTDGKISPTDRRALMVCAEQMKLGPVAVHDVIAEFEKEG